ncbi:hypothetical protein GIB67_001496, partial [Kingdonia uniflora]
MYIFENVDGDQFYYQGLLEYIMSDVVGINEVISPGSGIVVKKLCAVPIEVVPLPIIKQPDVVMMEDDEGPPICPTSQVEVETTQFDPLQHESTQFDPLQHETIARSRKKNTKRVKKLRESEVPEEELDDLPHMDFSNDEPNIKSEGGVRLEGMLQLEGEASNNGEEIDEVDVWIRWAETNPDSLDVEERVNPDGTTFSIRDSSNLFHTCPGRSGQSDKNENAQRVLKEVEETIRIVSTTRPAGVKELISRRYGADISYYTSWNAWIICMERIVGSYDEGYILQPEFVRRLKEKEWEEAGLVLVPRAQTHIDKMIKCYGQVGYGHNKKTCKGVPATPRPRVARAPKMVDTNVNKVKHINSIGLPPVIPNMRGRGSGDGGGGGSGGGRSSRGARLTQDTEAPRSTQTSQAPRQTRASTQQVQAPRQAQSRQTQSQTQATQGLRKSQSRQSQAIDAP